MKKIIFLISFITCMLALISFFSIDRCMDAGGKWGDWGFSCFGAGPDFIPLYKRTIPIFWVLALSVSGGVSFLITKLLPNAKP
jgi:hypothetical protein